MIASFYRQYKGRCAGRVIYIFGLYEDLIGTCNVDCQTIQIGNDCVIFRGKKIADIVDWTDNDVPICVFYGENRAALEKAQFLFTPLADEESLLFNFKYALQELRKDISLDDALRIMWVRDRWNGDWSQVVLSGDFKQKIKRSLNRSYWSRLTDEEMEKWWQHFAMCAVYDISGEKNENHLQS